MREVRIERTPSELQPDVPQPTIRLSHVPKDKSKELFEFKNPQPPARKLRETTEKRRRPSTN